MSKQAEKDLKRMKDLLLLTIGMLELMISEDEDALKAAEAKLNKALEELNDNGLN